MRLQEEGPTEQDVSTVLEIEQRAHENGLQVNLALKFVYLHHSLFYAINVNRYTRTNKLSFRISTLNNDKVQKLLLLPSPLSTRAT